MEVTAFTWAIAACQDPIAFFDQLRSNHHLQRHAKFHRTTLCVTGPRNQRSRALSSKTLSAFLLAQCREGAISRSEPAR